MPIHFWKCRHCKETITSLNAKNGVKVCPHCKTKNKIPEWFQSD